MRLQLILVILIAFGASLAWGIRVCVIDVRRCWARTNVCGRYGGSNLCRQFNTLCDLQAANCQQTAQYTEVNNALCRGIPAGTRRRCRRRNTGVNNGQGNGGFVGIGTGTGNGALFRESTDKGNHTATLPEDVEGNVQP